MNLYESEVYQNILYLPVGKLSGILRALSLDVIKLVNCKKKDYVRSLPKSEMEGATNYWILINFSSLTSLTKFLTLIIAFNFTFI